MNAIANATAHALANGTAHADLAESVNAKGREGNSPDLTSPDLSFSWASFTSWRWVTYRADRDAMMTLRARWSV